MNLSWKNLEIINDRGMPIHYHVEVAKTYEEQKTGLMHRKKLEENTGMFFLFSFSKLATPLIIHLKVLFFNVLEIGMKMMERFTSEADTILDDLNLEVKSSSFAPAKKFWVCFWGWL